MAEQAADLAREYLSLQSTIKVLEEQAEECRVRLKAAVGFDAATEGQTWDFPDDGVRVMWVKGRTTSKLDPARLVKAGVTAEQIEKGTVRSTFQPSMRVVDWHHLDSTGD